MEEIPLPVDRDASGREHAGQIMVSADGVGDVHGPAAFVRYGAYPSERTSLRMA